MTIIDQLQAGPAGSIFVYFVVMDVFESRRLMGLERNHPSVLDAKLEELEWLLAEGAESDQADDIHKAYAGAAHDLSTRAGKASKAALNAPNDSRVGLHQDAAAMHTRAGAAHKVAVKYTPPGVSPAHHEKMRNQHMKIASIHTTHANMGSESPSVRNPSPAVARVAAVTAPKKKIKLPDE